MMKGSLRSIIKSRITRQERISESFVLSVVLAFSGGFQDAYTYFMRDRVFANAQTGNIVLMSAAVVEGHWTVALRYLPPLLAFVLGVFLTEEIRNRYRDENRVHWRQTVLILEVLILFAVGIIPQKANVFANVLVSFSCAMQVQSFQKVAGNNYASTMCIGNLRSGTAAFFVFIKNQRREDLESVLCYFGVILVFALGAGSGAFMSAVAGARAIWLSCTVLLIAFFLMELDRNCN